MLIFVALCAFLVIIGVVLLYQKAQGRKSAAPRKDLTDALLRFKNQNNIKTCQTPSEELTRELCQKLKNNIYIDPLFEDRYKCMFEYDLYGEYEHFCVNLKAIPTCDAVSLPSEILIGVKVYNVKEELLHAESIWLYFSEEEPRYACSFYLESLRIADVAFMKIHPIEKE